MKLISLIPILLLINITIQSNTKQRDDYNSAILTDPIVQQQAQNIVAPEAPPRVRRCDADCVSLYTECGYQGTEFCLCEERPIYNLDNIDFRGQRILSIDGPGEFELEFFRGPNQTGERVQINHDEECLERAIILG